MIFKKKFDELTADEIYKIIDLRLKVFLEEQKILYVDTDYKDYHSIHYFIKDGDKIVCYLRVVPKGLRFDDYVSLGRIVTDERCRHQGLATKLIKKALSDLKQDVKISGQAYLKDYYLSLGFVQCSDAYIEEEILHYEFIYKQ